MHYRFAAQLSALEDTSVDVPKCFESVALVAATVFIGQYAPLSILETPLKAWYEDEKRSEFLLLVAKAVHVSGGDVNAYYSQVPLSLQSFLLSDYAKEFSQEKVRLSIQLSF